MMCMLCYGLRHRFVTISVSIPFQEQETVIQSAIDWSLPYPATYPHTVLRTYLLLICRYYQEALATGWSLYGVQWLFEFRDICSAKIYPLHLHNKLMSQQFTSVWVGHHYISFQLCARTWAKIGDCPCYVAGAWYVLYAVIPSPLVRLENSCIK